MSSSVIKIIIVFKLGWSDFKENNLIIFYLIFITFFIFLIKKFPLKYSKKISSFLALFSKKNIHYEIKSAFTFICRKPFFPPMKNRSVFFDGSFCRFNSIINIEDSHGFAISLYFTSRLLF